MNEFETLFPFEYEIWADGKTHSKTLTLQVTPEIAIYCFNHNDKNRKAQKKQVDMIYRQIMEDKFIDDGNSITFDKNGDVIDGGHRMTAFKKAFENGYNGVISLRFIHSLEDKAKVVRHTARPDTSTDFIAMFLRNVGLKGKGPASMYGVISQLYNYIVANEYIDRKKNDSLTLESFIKVPEVLEQIIWISQFNNNFSSSYDKNACVSAVLFIIMHIIDEKKAEKLARQFYNNDCSEGQNKTLYNLEQFYVNKTNKKKNENISGENGSDAELKYAYNVSKAFNAILHDKDIQKFSNRTPNPKKNTFSYQNRKRIEDISGKFEEFRRNLFEKNIIILTK